MVVHSRSVALFVALKQATECLLDEDSNREAVITTLLAHASSDKVHSHSTIVIYVNKGFPSFHMGRQLIPSF